MTYTAPRPPPCRAMRRNPLVLGLSGASLAAINAPRWDVLIDLWASSASFSGSPKLTAPRSAAAVLALVASPVRHHQHAALGASRRTLVRVARLGRRRK